MHVKSTHGHILWHKKTMTKVMANLTLIFFISEFYDARHILQAEFCLLDIAYLKY